MTPTIIETMTGLTGVSLTREGDEVVITAAEPVPPAVERWVRRCMSAGEVLPLVPLYSHTPTGWDYALGTTADDLEAWTRLLVLLREAEALAVVTSSTELPIRDATGNMHMVSVSALRAALVEIGFAWQQAWAQAT